MNHKNHLNQFLIIISLLIFTNSQAIAFVGSDACLVCHSDQHEKWVDSGHPYKLTAIDGEAPTDSFPAFSAYPNNPINPPAGTTWSDFSYVIGGYGWKMRWIQNDGYIYTPAWGQNQYNFENETWSNYHAGETKPYDCGACHTTGWVGSDDGNASNNQGGMEGFLGTFFASGVHCEQCHGEGDAHVSDPTHVNMVVDSSSELCGQCHTRADGTLIEASGGFIKHHEQYDEWRHSPHLNGPGCNDCHDPHSSVKYDDIAQGDGVLTSCENCHPFEVANNYHPPIGECVDCHMPKASKSAVAVNIYQGDIRTHIWSINTDSEYNMFSIDGTSVVEDAQGQSQINLAFACYGCHNDGSGGGGQYSTKTLVELENMATDIHGALSDVEPGMIPAAVALTGAYPNPFNPQTKITFSVSNPQHVTIAVYDMAGQQVAQLSDQFYSAGEHTTGWNGKNILGRDVASGVYLVNIRAKSVSQSLKIQLVR
jgi:hypothetical protein